MTKKTEILRGQIIELIIHEEDGEVSEVYALWNGMEIGFGYSEQQCLEQVDAEFKAMLGLSSQIVFSR